jgi:mono/diheme cytochrome c family protein
VTKSLRRLSGFVLLATMAACQGEDDAATVRPAGSPDSTTAAREVADEQANGERIFRNATSRSSVQVRSTGQRQPDGKPVLSCGDCHGANGRGGSISLQGRIVHSPDIRFDALTRGRADLGLPPYDEVTLGLTLRTGVTPDGRKLDSIMPRWQMSASDLSDLVTFLRSLTPAADSMPGP